MQTTVIRASKRRVAAVFVGVAAAALIGISLTSNTASADAPGNNGTLKIHEQGTPSGTENNDPKVCVFNVESFNLDAGQTGYLDFTVQGGDGPTGVFAGPYTFGPADATGYFASQYFNLSPGHYKATLYGKYLPVEKSTGGVAKSGGVDVKAKSKVFKVTCVETPPTTVPPTTVPPTTVPPTTVPPTTVPPTTVPPTTVPPTTVPPTTTTTTTPPVTTTTTHTTPPVTTTTATTPPSTTTTATTPSSTTTTKVPVKTHVKTPPSSTTPPALAVTGFSTGPVLTLAGLMILLGMILVGFRYRGRLLGKYSSNRS